MKKLLIICGPTAVGKSALALKLAQELNTEIISCDSMQIYKGLDIGTAKPDKSEQGSVKHNLIDLVNPDKDFSVFDYVKNCEKVIERLNDEDKIPLIAGGTGLYIKSLLYSYNFSKSDKDEEIRKNLNEELKIYGNEYLYDKLYKADKKSAEAIHKNDTKRVIRALEIFYTSGLKKSEAAVCQAEPKYEYLLIGLNLEREELYKRINLRVDLMVKNGLVEEVRNLLNICDKNNQSMQAIGYKQIIEYLEGGCALELAVEKIKQLSRNYAKRQITYFKSIPDIVWIDANTKNLDKKILNLYNNV